MMKILCLDFDGVICDSIDESMLVAYNSYQIFHNHTHNIISHLDHIPPEISSSFREFRYLVRPAGEYWLLMHALCTNISDLTQKSFNEMSLRYRETITAFETIFFETRGELKKQYPKEWLSLHRLYPQFLEAWPSVQQRFEVHIVTTKNLCAVVQLNKHFNISIPENRIWTREKVKEKKEAIQFIAERHGGSFENIIFIDDHPLHLQDVAKTGIQCLWASWGYTKEILSKYNIIKHLEEVLDEV